MSFKNKLQYCTRCLMPETQEGVNFDELGICTACQSSEDKMHIDWSKREKILKKILNDAQKKSGNNYDCILPISGGKDSFFQAHVLTKKYNLKPLAVTFNHNWFSKTGYHNLQLCLESFNLDHIQFSPSRNLVAKASRRSLEKIGDSCWHCHSGVGAFPIQIAVKFKIPLLIWGENVSETSGRDTYGKSKYKYDKDFFVKISAKKTPSQMVSKQLSKKDLYPFELPSQKEVDEVGCYGIHLGDFIFWDDERQVEFIKKKYGWKETKMEGTYKNYKSAECIMAGVHDYTCYLKRGFGRATWQASNDIRRGLLSKKDAEKLVEQYDSERPHALDYYLKITGYSEKEFMDIMKKKRVSKLKDKDVPIKKKNRLHPEKLIPHPQQIIEKIKGEN